MYVYLSVKSSLNLASKLDLIDFGVIFDKSHLLIISKNSILQFMFYLTRGLDCTCNFLF